METVEKLYDVKSTFINIEMDIPFLKIGGTCFPHFCLGVKRLDDLPRSRANAFAVGIRADKHIQRDRGRFFLSILTKLYKDAVAFPR